MKKPSQFCASVLILILTSCTGDRYSQSPSLTPQNAATLIGSRIQHPGFLRANIWVEPVQIDGQFTSNAWYNDSSSRWNKPFLVTPGPHQVSVEVVVGASAWGNVNFDVSLQPGTTYHMMATDPAPIPGSRFSSLSYAWLQDGSGNAITPRLPVQVNMFTGSDMIAIPSDSGGTPMFIPPHS